MGSKGPKMVKIGQNASHHIKIKYKKYILKKIRIKNCAVQFRRGGGGLAKVNLSTHFILFFKAFPY